MVGGLNDRKRLAQFELLLPRVNSRMGDPLPIVRVMMLLKLAQREQRELGRRITPKPQQARLSLRNLSAVGVTTFLDKHPLATRIATGAVQDMKDGPS